MEQERAQGPSSTAPEVAEHLSGGQSAGPADPVAELRRLAAALRTHLLWLRAGGVHGLPRPAQQVARPPAQRTPHRAQAPSGPAREEPPAEVFPWQAPTIAPVQREAAAHAAPQRPAPPPVPQQQQQRESLRQAAPVLPDPLPVLGQAGLDLVREVLGNCQRCKLCHGRTHLVLGQGSPQARLVFVGEGPGAEEDRTGLAFVGAAGDLLTKMIGAMGFGRDEVFICNVVKCRPPGNRTPEPDEMETCGPFLRGQLQALRPQMIVALGRTPTHFLLKTAAPLSRLRGRFASWEGIPVMPTYHPAYLLRTPSAKRQVWEDLQLVMAALRQEGAAAAAPPAPPAAADEDGAGALAENGE